MAKQEEIIDDIKHHYDLIRNNEDKVVDKLNLHLGFFSFRKQKKIKSVEIIYDTPNNLLSTAGIVLSKQINEQGSAFKVRKISHIPANMRRSSKKIQLTECGVKNSPKDFAMQVATLINNSFSNIFTIDLGEVVKKTVPKIEIFIKGNIYEIHGGTGFTGTIMFEKVTYRDVATRKKVIRKGATVMLPGDESYEKDRNDILEGIEIYCKELIPYKETRFEIAQRVLYPKHNPNKLSLKELKKQSKGKVEEEKEEN